jgi:Fe-S-cluster-containing dehydrogenase component
MQPICVEACSGRALFFAPIDELPSGEGRADIAPLPAEDFTGPNLYLKKCVSMQPVATDVAISNILEVM